MKKYLTITLLFCSSPALAAYGNEEMYFYFGCILIFIISRTYFLIHKNKENLSPSECRSYRILSAVLSTLLTFPIHGYISTEILKAYSSITETPFNNFTFLYLIVFLIVYPVVDKLTYNMLLTEQKTSRSLAYRVLTFILFFFAFSGLLLSCISI